MLNWDSKVREVNFKPYSLNHLTLTLGKWKKIMNLYFCQMLRVIRKNTALFDGSQASSARPSGKMTMNQYNDTSRKNKEPGAIT